jgi:hypothetical protein
MMFLFWVWVKGVSAIVVAAGSVGGRPGSQQEGPARDAECPPRLTQRRAWEVPGDPLGRTGGCTTRVISGAL